MIINASSLDDIEPSAIGQRLTNGTASVASPVLSRLKTREEENVDVVSRATMCAGLSVRRRERRLPSTHHACPSPGHCVREDQRGDGDEEDQQGGVLGAGQGQQREGRSCLQQAGGAKITALKKPVCHIYLDL